MQSKQAKIFVVGSINADLIMRLASIPASGETVVGGTFSQAAGGKGANAAVAASRAGGLVSFVGAVGHDANGDAMIQNLRADGIGTRFIAQSEAPTGTAFILLDSAGHNSIAVASGANYALTQAEIEAARSEIATADWVIMSNELSSTATQFALEIASQAGVSTLFNYAPAAPRDIELSAAMTLLVVNEHEAASLSGLSVSDITEAKTAARWLQNKGPREVIVTLGGQGAVVCNQDDVTHLPCFAVKPVDTTAAGDTFCGALTVALGEGLSLLEATRFAQAASALGVTRAGAQPSIPKRAEIDAFLSDNSF